MFEGDWVKFRDGVAGTFTTIVYVLAAAIGVITGNWWLTAAAIVALDGQHNNGNLTYEGVKLVGKVETALLDTHFIEEYAREISTTLVIIGSVYAGYVGGGAIMKLVNIGSLNAVLKAYSYASSLYGIYDNLQKFEEFRAYYKKLLDEYKAWAEQVQQAYAQTKTQWFEMFANLENQEVCYQAMAGGYLYNAGAGSDEYSVSSIHEPNAYMLGIDTKRDVNHDRMLFMNDELDYQNLNFKYYKEPINKWI